MLYDGAVICEMTDAAGLLCKVNYFGGRRSAEAVKRERLSAADREAFPVRALTVRSALQVDDVVAVSRLDVLQLVFRVDARKR